MTPPFASRCAYLLESVSLPVETFATAQEFLDAYTDDRAGCLVLDVRLPGMSGLELQEKLAARGTPLPTIIITGHGDVPMAVRAMKTGAIEFLEKPFSDQGLVDRVQQAIRLDSQVRRQRAQCGEVAARLQALTLREREVLERVVMGKSNKEMAANLDISTKTVEAVRARLMRKMQADSLAELVRMAMLVEKPNEPKES